MPVRALVVEQRSSSALPKRSTQVEWMRESRWLATGWSLSRSRNAPLGVMLNELWREVETARSTQLPQP